MQLYSLTCTSVPCPTAQQRKTGGSPKARVQETVRRQPEGCATRCTSKSQSVALAPTRGMLIAFRFSRSQERQTTENRPPSSAGQTNTRRHAPRPPLVTANKPSSNSVSVMRWDPVLTHARTQTQTQTEYRVRLTCPAVRHIRQVLLGRSRTKCTQVNI